MSAEAVLARRRVERKTMLERARAYAEGLTVTGVRAVVVFGSVARGDFNRWSDIDVLVVAEGLEGGLLQRADALEPRPAGVQVVGWTPAEWGRQLVRGNPIAREAVERGVWLRGEAPLHRG